MEYIPVGVQRTNHPQARFTGVLYSNGVSVILSVYL